jgi:hypothetical protein
MRSETKFPQLLAPLIRRQMDYIALWPAFGITPHPFLSPSERSSGNLVADDNGSECINQVITDWYRNPACPIPFTRSRDHKKNDNCLRTSGPSRTEKRRLRQGVHRL